MTPVFFQDGVRFVECDKCTCEIRGVQVNVGVKVYHPGCAPS